MEGVAHYGRGQWADIKSLNANGVAAALASRSAVDLKDKWRNLLRIAMLPVLYKRREATEVPRGDAGARPRARRAEGRAARRRARRRAGGGGFEPRRGRLVACGRRAQGRTKEQAPLPVDAHRVRGAGGRRRAVRGVPLDGDQETRTGEPGATHGDGPEGQVAQPSAARVAAEPVAQKSGDAPELLQRVLRLEAEFGVARRKGRKAADEAPAPAAATA